jgi:hypothetical protein
VQALLEKAILGIDIELQHLATLGGKLKRTHARNRASAALNSNRLAVRYAATLS